MVCVPVTDACLRRYFFSQIINVFIISLVINVRWHVQRSDNDLGRGKVTWESRSKGCWWVKVRWMQSTRCFSVSFLLATCSAYDHQISYTMFLNTCICPLRRKMHNDIVSGEPVVCTLIIIPDSYCRMHRVDSGETPLNRLSHYFKSFLIMLLETRLLQKRPTNASFCSWSSPTQDLLRFSWHIVTWSLGLGRIFRKLYKGDGRKSPEKCLDSEQHLPSHIQRSSGQCPDVSAGLKAAYETWQLPFFC